MKPISVAVAVLVVVSLCSFQAQGDNELITKACSRTAYNDLCKAILQAAPNSNDADLYGLTQFALSIAAQNVSNIYQTIDKLQNDSSVDSFMDECLTDCLENYQDATDQIEDSVTALEFKAFNDVRTWVAAAMSDVATCDLGFKDKPGYQSPVHQMSAVFDQICSIVLTFNHCLIEGNVHLTS
ncbi:pectinesterase inhibitor 7-like [Cucurbita maxima]|uniref:Pectinesterase inhibitor 7-like n=1 Tax=Cucurbita maxima TaxID=3661 RepID=A0A6J1I2M6_CUCMA|nr:pectinesterase inhibitor 7-like [Cucurbita maxima]